MKISRSLKWIFWIVGGALTALGGIKVLLMAYFIFLLAGEPSKDEVARDTSPTGKVDALLLETNGGATTSFGYEVYIVEHDAQPSVSPAVSCMALFATHTLTALILNGHHLIQLPLNF